MNEKVYNLPLTTNAWGFFYNLDKFQDLKLEFSRSWQAFEQLVAVVQEVDEILFVGSFSTQDLWMFTGYHQLAWTGAVGGPEEVEEYLRFNDKDSISGEDEHSRGC